MNPKSIRLFIKPSCPWCDEAIEWLQTREIPFESIDVTQDPTAYAEMVALTGQRKAPCLEADDEVLADFGVDELEEWWQEMGYTN
ncbi:MAG: glutaredoxin family protein [Pedosphaera sp.]|nr:glutaredoxin family protein [Pedosphaera sp.]